MVFSLELVEDDSLLELELLSSASLRDADAMSNLPVAGGDRVYHNHRVLEHVGVGLLDQDGRARK